VEPYFRNGLVTIYHGDFRDVDAWLSGDVLVTDPPYGMSYVSNKSKDGPSDPIAGDATPDSRDEVLRLWGGRPALVFGTWRVDRPANVRQLVVWDKGNVPGMGDLSMPWGPAHEEVYVLGDGFSGRRRSNVLRCNTLAPTAEARPDHPTPKPVPLLRELVSYCPPGVVVDPFLGSGTTALACLSLGRRCIGVEIEERYCELAARRIQQEGAQVSLLG